MLKEIQSEIEKIRRKYIDSAEEIVSGYNRECTLSKDYEGRQMYELLQNADDEAEGSSGKVLIEFVGKTLSVSNTGAPFSIDGVKSLLYPNASPKMIHENKIGCKGLGFRSILTWADSVTIASKDFKDFTIQFSRKYAEDVLKSIYKEKPELEEEISSKLTKEPYPIATLTCPHILKKSALVDGYDTSIIIECRENISDTIIGQIKSLEFEELIFLHNLKQIEIVCEDYHKSFNKIVEDDKVIIEATDPDSGTTECSSWKLFKQTDKVKDEEGNDKDYEFIMAYDPDGKRRGEVLYSYFKTDVKLGFPALIHGTFELTSDRNSLQKESKVNKQLIPLLADFMVQCAVKISKEQKECNYAPLKLILTPDMDYVLKNNFKLDALLRKKARGKKILPTIANEYISVNDNPKYSAVRFDKVLHPHTFPNMLKCAEDQFVEDYITKKLSIGFYEYSEFCQIINRTAEDYSLEERAELIALLLKQYSKTCGEYPHLLVDRNGNSILDNCTVYPLPEEKQEIALPNWVDIKFLNQDMANKLCSILNINSRRELVNALSGYNLDEYSFEKLLRGVVNRADKEIDSVEKCSDILNWLWNYYNREDRQPIPDVKIKVICRDGTIKCARDCYIGSEYGNDLGERLVSLFSGDFVARDELGLDCGDTARIVGFLEWLGVARYPRLEVKPLSWEKRRPFVDSCCPLSVNNHEYSKDEIYYINSVQVRQCEQFDLLLDKADFNDLLAWFLLDDKINKSLCSENEYIEDIKDILGDSPIIIDFSTKGARQGKTERVFIPYIKSYIRYCLSRAKWISYRDPDPKEPKKAPAYCCFQDNQLAPFIVVPAINYAKIKGIVGRDCTKEVDALLSRIGVAAEFEELQKKVVYEALMKLPELDPECKNGKSIYRKIIRSGVTPEEYANNNPAYNKFVKNGSVLVKIDGKKQYVPVSEAYYADKKVFSEAILKNFKMFDADSHSGEGKIKKLFGVKPLKYTDVEVEGSPVFHRLDEAFRKEYSRFIPFVYACRCLKSGQKNADTDFSRLKDSKTKIFLCSKITIKYVFEDKPKPEITPLGEFYPVYMRETNRAYICVPDRYPDWDSLKRDLRFADAVAEMITSILDVNEDKEFYRDLFRESDVDRKVKIQMDKGDDTLEMLDSARKRFNTEINPRDEFWITMAELLYISDSENSSAEAIMAKLRFDDTADKDIDYNNINSMSNAEQLIEIFIRLGLDVDKFNAFSTPEHEIDLSRYWANKLKAKMRQYSNKYLAYLYNDLQENPQCVELYDQYRQDYTFFEPENMNSVSVDIDSVFKKEFGVSFDTLDSFLDDTIETVIQQEKGKLSADAWSEISQRYPNIAETYLIFGQIDTLIEKNKDQATEPSAEPAVEQNLKSLVEHIFSSPPTGFSDIKTSAKLEISEHSHTVKQSQHHRAVHSEAEERKKQEIGIAGETCVYKELLEIDPDARWVSGNAEKAGKALQGDDTCGYDIIYIDENGTTQYVEVKASRNEDITFVLSDSELQFALRHASCYAIFYVVIGKDGKPAHEPWRLRHLFEFDEGEDLFHNSRFSIVSDSYRVTAKPIKDLCYN